MALYFKTGFFPKGKIIFFFYIVEGSYILSGKKLLMTVWLFLYATNLLRPLAFTVLKITLIKLNLLSWMELENHFSGERGERGWVGAPGRQIPRGESRKRQQPCFVGLLGGRLTSTGDLARSRLLRPLEERSPWSQVLEASWKCWSWDLSVVSVYV